MAYADWAVRAFREGSAVRAVKAVKAVKAIQAIWKPSTNGLL